MIDKVCISVNAQCNLACKYCHFYNNESLANMEYAQGFSKKELSIILDNIVYYADKNQVPKFAIGFAGGGEPLLSWNIISSTLDDIYDKDDNKRLYFYIITNGILLDYNFLQQYKKFSSFVNLVVSLDGDTKTHDVNRIDKKYQATHQKIMDNIKGYYITFNKMPNINLSVGKMAYGRKKIILDFLIRNGFDSITFTKLFHCNDKTQEITNEQFYEFINYFKSHNLTIRNIESIKNNKIDCIYYGNKCGVGINNIFYFDKKIYPCMRFVERQNGHIGTFDEDLSILESKMQKLLKPVSTKECYYEKY